MNSLGRPPAPLLPKGHAWLSPLVSTLAGPLFPTKPPIRALLRPSALSARLPPPPVPCAAVPPQPCPPRPPAPLPPRRPLAPSPADGHRFPGRPSPEPFPARGGRPLRRPLSPPGGSYEAELACWSILSPRPRSLTRSSSPPRSQPLTRALGRLASNISLVCVARP